MMAAASTRESPLLWHPPLWPKLVLALVGGCAIFLATARFDIWPLAWVGLVPLMLLAELAPTPRRAFGWGLLIGWVTNLGGFYWIPHLLERFGQLPSWAAFLLLGLLAAYQGLGFAFFAWAFHRARRKNPTLSAIAAAPLLWMAFELLLPMVFPWYLSITQAWQPWAIQSAELGGPLAVSGLLALSNGLLYEGLCSRWLRPRPYPRRALIVGTALIAGALLFGQLRLYQVDQTRSAAPKLKVGVVQANLGIVQHNPGGVAARHHRLHLDYSTRLQEQGAELLLWPESAYPFAIERERRRDFASGDPRQVMRGLRVPLVFGAATYGRASRYPYNTAFLANPKGEFVATFDKNYLMIFGEYIPFYEAIPRFREWIPAASHFNRGTEVTTFPLGPYKLGPLICYEDIIPAFTRRLAKLKPNLLLNITNDAWFGATSEPYQHLALAVFRSVELRLDLVRAVNTGVSTHVDATGRVRAISGAHDPALEPGVKPETLLVDAAMMPARQTLYTLAGDYLGYLGLAALLGWLWLLPWYRRSSSARGAKARR